MGHTEEFTSVEWFAGGAGNHQGLSRVIPNLRCIAFCEREGYAVSNLVAAMEEGRMAPAPIWTDCRTFPVEPFLDRRLDLFIASYPCQGESVAGNQLGTEDPRFLWPYCREFVAAVRPVWCFFENVRGHVNTSMVNVLRDLAELQYAVEPGIFSAEECGGSHSRERVFILARRMEDADCPERWPSQPSGYIGDGNRPERGQTADRVGAAGIEDLAHPHSQHDDGSGIGREGGRLEPANGGGSDLDDSPSLGCGTRRTEPEGEQGGLDAAEPGCELADTLNSGSQGSSCQQVDRGRVQREAGRGGYHLPQSPPGPNDDAGWYRVLFDRPWLAPSLRRSEAERIFCRVADVMADESHLHELRGLFCENRVDRLRMLGNGVYPESAAVAFMTLLLKMGATI